MAMRGVRGERRETKTFRVTNRIWFLAWYAGFLSNRSRSDYIMASVEKCLCDHGVVDKLGRMKPEHKERAIELAKLHGLQTDLKKLGLS